MENKSGIASDILMATALLIVMIATVTYSYQSLIANIWNSETITSLAIMMTVFTSAVVLSVQLAKNSVIAETRTERNQQ